MEQFIFNLLNLFNQHPLTAFSIGSLLLMCITGVILLLLSLRNFYFLKKKMPVGPSKNVIRTLLIIGCLFIVVVLFSGFVIKQYLPIHVYLTTSSSFSGKENIWLSPSGKSFGIDVSHYQGAIDWDKVNTSAHSIDYVFVRSTMGADGEDYQFNRNWQSSKENYLRGAYHYYRPNENSVLQFRNFSRVVQLSSGDLPPVLDIEEMGKYGKENLVAGVLNWLRLAEQHYGVKPIVYTGSNFYDKFLKGHIEDYPLWIAAYSGTHRLEGVNWSFHQFSDKIRVNGINSFVDGNSFNGKMPDLIKLVMK